MTTSRLYNLDDAVDSKEVSISKEDAAAIYRQIGYLERRVHPGLPGETYCSVTDDDATKNVRYSIAVSFSDNIAFCMQGYVNSSFIELHFSYPDGGLSITCQASSPLATDWLSDKEAAILGQLLELALSLAEEDCPREEVT